ncbi:MAG: efflux RND transporter permease subunit [Calditrichaeota bacterium]|nr:efflux RND transporter permease subunit [Calditrichota bacterium]
MHLPKIAIENHQFTIIMVTLLTIMGVISFINMPRSEDPAVSPPGSSVIVVYPGTSPEDLENLVVDPIEESLNELEDIKKLDATVDDGLAIIQIEFTAGSNPDDKYTDVLQKVNRVRNDLPKDILALDILKWSISDVNVLQLALVSEKAEYSELEQKAEILQTEFERLPGVKKSNVFAFPEQQVSLLLDLERMAQLGIPVNQVFGAIQSANANIPAGSIDMGTKKFNVKTSGSFESLSEIQETIIHARNGSPVKVKDIADVRFDYEEVQYKARVNGEKAVYITLLQKQGTNIFTVMDEVYKTKAAFEKSLPANMKLFTVFDQSNSVAGRLNLFFSNLGQGVLLVALVIFFAFGLNMSLIIAAVIPLSIIIAIGFVDLTGYGLQQMTIVALVIALGLLVDNAIVVIENIQRFLKMGFSKTEAAVKGVSQVGWAVVSSTVTTILSFVPLMMLGEVTGDFIRSMPVTVVYALAASLFLALTFTPYIASKFLKQDNKISQRFYNKIDGLVSHQYRSSLDYALKHRKTVLLISTIAFVGSMALFPLVGVSFFPKAEKNQFMVNIRMPKGTNLERTDTVTREVENMLTGIDGMGHFASNIGHGNPRIYYNIFVQRENSSFAQIFIQLGTEDMDRMAQIIDTLRIETSKIAGAKIEVKEFEQGPPVEAPVAIKILGENLDVIKKIAADVEKIISSKQGTINVNNPLQTSATDLHVNINRNKAAIYGLSISDVDLAVRMALSGLNLSTYRDDNGKEYNIVGRMDYHDKTRISDFEKLYINTIQGNAIPLKQVATIEFKESPAQISHFKTQRSVTVTADVSGGSSVDEVTRDVISELEQYNWPEGYSYYIGGELESRGESFGGLMKAVIVAMIAIFGVLVLQFRSFSQPFIVFSAIPLAMIGSIFALLLTGNSFSFTAGVGLTSLVGIVINNSIILVDYTNQLRREGMDMIAALKEAGETRFVPIILTTATTIGGLLPLTLSGGTLWAPMGWTIIGGLALSTLLTLIVVPVLYNLFTKDELKPEHV